MKSVYKINSTTWELNRETNLMRLLTAKLENVYCSITVANYGLIRLVRFITQSYTHL
jgi:hypothetical protein